MEDDSRDVRPVRPDDAEQLRPLLGKGTHHLPGLEMFLRPLPGDEGYLPDAFVAVTASGEVVGYAELVERRDTAELSEPLMLRGHTDERLELALRRALEREAARRGLRIAASRGPTLGPSSQLPLGWLAFLTGSTLTVAAPALGFWNAEPLPGWFGPLIEWQLGLLLVGGLLIATGARGVVRSLSGGRVELPRMVPLLAALAVVALIFALLVAVWYVRLVALPLP